VEEIVFLEILGPAGKVKNRVKLDRASITLGRSYENDVILDDPFVSPRHLRLEQTAEGAWTATDMQSENGLFDLSSSRRVPSVELTGQAQVRIGHTVLRLRRASDAVPPTRLDHGPLGWLGIFKRPWCAPLAFACFAVLRATYTYLGEYDNLAAAHQVRDLTFIIFLSAFLLLTWAGGWALLGRLILHETNFLAHFSIACFGQILLMLFVGGWPYAAFAFSLPAPSPLSYELMGACGICIAVFYLHLRFCFQSSPRRLLTVSAGAMGTLFGIVGFILFLSESEFSTKLKFPSELKPPEFRISKPIPLPTFLNKVPELKNKVDAQAKKDPVKPT
jgi:hypothetical protein